MPTVANGMPAFGQYKPGLVNGGWEPWPLQVVDMAGDRISTITFFLDTARLLPDVRATDSPQRPPRVR
jgi:RNA polymerase sigma-70 factor, ECF subfamily